MSYLVAVPESLLFADLPPVVKVAYGALEFYSSGGHVLDDQITMIATRLNTSVSTFRKHVQALLEKGFLRAYESELGLVFGLVYERPLEEMKEKPTSAKRSRKQYLDEELGEDFFETFIKKFFELYPARSKYVVGKKASAEWMRQNLTAGDIQPVLRGVNNYKQSDAARRGFACDPIRFLKEKRWVDYQVEITQRQVNKPTL